MRKFGLFLMMTSLVALTSLFSACKADLEGDYPQTSVELVAGTSAETGLTFTIKANGADDIYYWVVDTATETEENTLLDISKGTYLDADVKTPFEQEVTVSNLAADTEYHIYAHAKNFVHNSFAKAITMSTGAAIPVPTVAVSVVEDEVYEDAFMVLVSTTNAKKASWLVVPKYTEGVTAQTVFEKGTALAASQLNKKDVEVIVEGLEAATEYDFYLAAENQGKQALSEVVFVVTANKTAVPLELVFDTCANSVDLVDAVGLPGIYFTLANTQTGAQGSFFMYDMATYPDYPGYLSGGLYPLLNGSLMSGNLPETSCVLADTTMTNFMDAEGKGYFPVGVDLANVDSAVDEDGNPYGVSLMTTMPNEDNNLVNYNIPVVDEAGTPYVVRGEYIGSLGYAVTPATKSFNLDEFGFDEFEATVDGNTVTLVSTSINGSFKMVLETENGQVDGAAFVAGEGGNLTGGYTSYLEGDAEVFEFTQGRIAFVKVDDNGNWVLSVSPRAGDWIMVGPSYAYSIEATDYEITISGLSSTAAVSVDAKRWTLPAAVSSVLLPDYPNAVCFVDMGVAVSGKLLIACDFESVYGADAAGYAQALMNVNYTVEPTDATSSNIVVVSSNMAGESTTATVPYTDLTEESVKIDLTSLFGNMGIGVCECTLFTKEIVSIQ